LIKAGRPLATGLALLASDGVALLAAGWLGVQVWSLANPAIGLEFYLYLLPALAVFFVVYGTFGLYPGVGLGPVEELRNTTLATTLVYLVASASIFLSKEVAVHSRGVFLSSWFFSLFLVPSGRAFLRFLFAAKPWWGVPVVVFGAGDTGRMVVDRLVSQPGLGWKPVALLDDEDSNISPQGDIPVVGPLSLAPELASADQIRHALVAMPHLKRQELLRVLERMGTVFPHVIVVPDLLGMSSLWVSPRDLGGVLGLEIRQNLLIPFNRWMKRGLDLALASVAGLLSLPLILIAVAWIKRVSPGPAFFLQEREGEGGRKIRVRKLRTMYLDADMLLLRFLERDPAARDEWQRYFKLKRDPRILPGIGHLLRRTSLDEVPQLWNVLKGEMSLVGPRPFPNYHLAQFDSDFRAIRTRVPPGLTGLWQVSARSNGDLKIQESLDTYYIRNWSLWLDLHILARTVRAVISRDGAY
jgi:Undecaprenyl-phosphate galactose phosphotransferase WbaP